MKTLLLMAAAGAVALAGDWSEPVYVMHQDEPVVTYRARTDGDWVLVKVDLEPGWHTFTMDNELRAKEALKGKMSLGVDKETALTVTGAAAVRGGWHQLPAKEFSKPDLNWFSWGYEREALFGAKADAKNGAAEVRVQGQACTDSVCKNIDIRVPFTATANGKVATDVSKLQPVR